MKKIKLYLKVFYTFTFLLFISLYLMSCGAMKQLGASMYASKDYFRVDNFPSIEGSAVSGATGNGIEYVYDAPINRVWPVIKQIADQMDRLSRKSVQGVELVYRPVVGFNENAYALQIGKIADPGQLGDLRGVGVNSNGHSWADEFYIKADPINGTQTKVRFTGELLNP